MAITQNGSINNIPSSKLPSGYTRPTEAGIVFTDFVYSKEVTLNVAKATVQNATKITTMNNIIADAGVGIDKQVQALLEGELGVEGTDPNATVYVELLDINSNIVVGDASSFYNDDAVNYVVKVKYFWKLT